MKTAIALAICLLAASARAEWTQPKWHETTLLVAAEALIVLDTWQSLSIKEDPYGYEQNPLLGQHPSDATFIAAGLISGVVLATTWYLMPSPWRNIVPWAVVVVEVPNTMNNFMMGCTVHF